MDWQTAFELADRWPTIVGQYVIAIALVVLAFVYIRRLKPTRESGRFDLARGAPIWLALLPAFIFAFTASATTADLRRLEGEIQTGQARSVEGVVTDFQPGSMEENRPESFVVDGHRFTYAPRTTAAAFNELAGRGGPLKPGLNVRITYVEDVIVKVEIATNE